MSKQDCDEPASIGDSRDADKQAADDVHQRRDMRRLSQDDEKPHEPSQPVVNQSSWTFRLTILCLITGTFLIALDQTILSPAVPSISSEFGALDNISWYGAAYLVTVTAFQPMYGKLYKYQSIRNTYLVSIAIFEVGSLMCGFAPSSTVFIAGRAVAGSGGAGLLQGAFAIITCIVPLQKRPFYISMALSTYVVCVCTGPILGGAFTTDVTWRWCFWINVPIGGVVFILIWSILRLPETRLKGEFKTFPLRKKILLHDPLGTLLIVSALVCFLLALQWGGVVRPWNSAPVIALLITCGILACLFCFTQVKGGTDALLPVEILGQRSIAACAAYICFFFMPTFVYGYWIPIYFQSVKAYSPIASARNYLSMAVPQIVTLMLSGVLASKTGVYVPFIVAGTIVTAIGTGFITTLDVNTPTTTWAAIFTCTALGTGLAQNLPFTAIQVHLSEEDVPSGNAIIQFSQQLGGSIGHAVGQSIFLNMLIAALREKTPQINPSDVIRAGAYDLPSIATSPQVLMSLREAYAHALRKMYIYPVVAACVALPLCLCIENRNIKKEAKRRESEKQKHEA